MSERAAGTVASELAESRFALGRALWETGARARGRALTEDAREGLRADAERYGSRYAEERAAIERWLAAHPVIGK